MATVPAEMTAVAGAILTAAEWNSNVRDGINFMLSRPLCIVTQIAPAQTINNATTTPVTFNSETIDRDGMHSLTTNTSRLTAVTAGYYLLVGAVAYPSNATGSRMAVWAVNGTGVPGGTVFAAAITGVAVQTIPQSSVVTYLNVGDYAELDARQDSGSNLTLMVSGGSSSSATALWESTA